MKESWLDRYREVRDEPPKLSDVVTGFNANIDVVKQAESFKLEEIEPRRHQKVESMEQLKQDLVEGMESCENRERKLLFDPELEGEESLGGQAGISANFLAKQGSGVVFYTPFLSDELSKTIDEHVLFPVMDGKFVLKNVRDASNTDRTKRNIIVEYENGCTGRIIFSRRMKGFGPYFRKGIEDNFEELEEGMDCAFLSGFHDTEGNLEAKLGKSAQQIEDLDLPVHVEYVHDEEVSEEFLDTILPAAESVGMDEDESLKIAQELDMEVSDDLSLGDSFQLAKKLIQQGGLERVHIHTYRFHVTVADQGVDAERIQDAMLFGELAALACADTAELPSSGDLENLGFEDIHLHRTDELVHFADFFDIEDFAERGTARVEGLTVVAIPTLIHENPERLVGMGDIISSGAWAAEN